MPTYVWNKEYGGFVDKHSGEKQPKIDMDSDSAVHKVGVVNDAHYSYPCPITGDQIEGKKAHEDNLKKHNCVSYA